MILFASLRVWILGGLAGLCAVGCLSRKVLDERSERAPAPKPNLELRLKVDSPADVLVIYDERDESTGRLTRRGFYLFANEQRLMRGKRPVFVKPGYIGPHRAVPIFTQSPADPQAVPGELYAISTSPWAFDLQSQKRSVAECRLPEYGHWLTAKKFFLFPLAAAADALGVTVVAGGAAAVIAAKGAAESNYSFRFP